MSARGIAKWMLIAGFAISACFFYPSNWPAYDFVTSFYAGLSVSLIGIALTVLLIDRANEQRARRDHKDKLIREVGSDDHGFATRAARELKAEGSLHDGSLENADLNHANLEKVDWENARLKGVTLAGANLKFAFLGGADLRYAKLQGVHADSLQAPRARLSKAVLQGAELGWANLEEVDAVGVDLLGVSLRQANLRGANLNGAQLEESDLRGADLTGSDLTGANMLRTNIESAILDNANLERADISELRGWAKVKSLQGVRISGVKNAPVGFRQWAVRNGARGASQQEFRPRSAE